MARTKPRAQTRKQPTKRSVNKKPTLLFYLFLAFSLLYAGISLLGPTDAASLAKYHLTQSQIHLLLLTIVIPFMAIWLSAYYGFSAFKKYAHVIKDTDEGPAFRQIAQGLGFLAFSLPVSSALSSLINVVLIRHPSYAIPLTIIKNYAVLILPLLAFISASRGAEKLTLLVKRRNTKPFNPQYWTIGVIIMSSIFSWLMVTRPADDRIAVNIYHLPHWLIIITLTVPYLYTWFRGILAAYYISYYQRNVKGSFYRKSLRFLSIGIFTVIMINILIQIITTLSTRLYRLHLTPILLIVYMLIALYALGFGWLAAGAKRMKKIEEV